MKKKNTNNQRIPELEKELENSKKYINKKQEEANKLNILNDKLNKEKQKIEEYENENEI